MSGTQHRGVSVFSLYLAMTFALGTLMMGCGAQPIYNWGLYENSLQASFVTHAEPEAFTDLDTTITSAQQTNTRIPPGACAEYGFLLYKRGDSERAIEYFQREAQLFPESKQLMDRLSAQVRAQAAAKAEPAVGGGAMQ